MPPEEQTLTGTWDRCWWWDGHVCWLGLCLVARIFHRLAYSPRLGNHGCPCLVSFQLSRIHFYFPELLCFFLGGRKIWGLHLWTWSCESWLLDLQSSQQINEIQAGIQEEERSSITQRRIRSARLFGWNPCVNTTHKSIVLGPDFCQGWC